MKSAKATISTKTFSIQALQFLAELYVQSAHDEEQNHGRDINHIMHKIITIRSITWSNLSRVTAER